MRFGGKALAAALLAAASMSGQGIPFLQTVSPSTAAAGGTGVTLLLTGAGFAPSSSVQWNNTPVPTSYNGPTQLTASIGANLLAAPGTFVVTVVNLGGGRSSTATFTVTSSLAIGQNPLPAATASVAYSYTFTASGGAPPFTWSAADVLPQGMALSAAGVLSGTPLNPGTYTVAVRVTDSGQSTAIRTAALTVSRPPVTVATASLPAGAVGSAYLQTLAASGGTAPYTWAATGLPAGVTLDRAGTLSGTPGLKGNYRINFQVSDAAGDVGSKALVLTVNAPPLALATESPLFDGTVGTGYAQTFTATGGTPPYTWSIVAGSTGELALDAARGTLTGVPQNAGSLAFTVQVGDSAGVSVSRAYVVNVGLPRLTITTVAGLVSGKVGVGYQQALTASGGIAPYTWSADAGIVPGLSIGSSSGIIADTPLAPGVFTFTVQVADSRGQTASKQFSITVAAATLALAGARDLPDALVGRPYVFSASATGGQGQYAWTANGLPEGLRLDAETGTLTGTPTAPGAFSFTLRVTDEARASALDLVRLNVRMPELPAPSFRSLPRSMAAAGQQAVGIELEAPYTTAVSGQLLLTFAPDKGPGDATIQFSAGGRTFDFTIPAGSTSADLPAGLALQSGTVAGTLLLSASLKSLGVEVGPAGGLTWQIRVEPGAPVVQSARASAAGSGIEVKVTGYSTARELTEVKLRFAAAQGNTLQTSEFTVPLDSATSGWFNDAANARYGSQFTLTLPFTVQGSASAVTLQSVTLANRYGATTFEVK